MADQIELTAERLWADVSERLRGALNETTYRTWFGETAAVALDAERLVRCNPWSHGGVDYP